ncbi:hypothetical protein [Sinomicrobium weinanense]|uniref:Uncharacterized protein n=1 Tax=Sinomicrobium weinanense TaxID=2842200 RepID=A0A926JTD1_9FLAO|nr:hypothetical protein [Sinomicrobium weinanense]MBC9797135.1 hypothetical protein [Sinomicrobium weinanense]MBU3124836.1 hypothetical protein [Sinomicrobium weinanense]
MWIRVSKTSVKQVDAAHLKNPKNPGTPMTLNLYQAESRTVFFVIKSKKAIGEYLETPTGRRIPKRKWSPQMEELSRSQSAMVSPLKGGFKVTLLGWPVLLLVIYLIGNAVYETATLPARKKAYEQEMAELATVHEGEIYFGRYRVYKEKGNFMDSKESGFGWFKVIKVEDDTYHIAKSVEISDIAKPKEELNSSDFEEESFVVKAKELEAYHKAFASEDRLVEIVLSEKKE